MVYLIKKRIHKTQKIFVQNTFTILSYFAAFQVEFFIELIQ